MKRILSFFLVCVLALTACSGTAQTQTQDQVVAEVVSTIKQADSKPVGMKMKGEMDLGLAQSTMDLTADKGANTYMKMSVTMAMLGMTNAQDVEFYVSGGHGYVKQEGGGWQETEGLSKETLMKNTMLPGKDQVKELEDQLKKAKMTEKDGAYVFDMDLDFKEFSKSTGAQDQQALPEVENAKLPVKMTMKFDQKTYRLIGLSFDGTEAMKEQITDSMEGMGMSPDDYKMVGNFDIEYQDDNFQLAAPDGIPAAR